jgi:hypothetical protein
MNNITRRSLISRAALSLTTLGLFTSAPHATEAQLVWQASDWKLADFQKLVNDPARIKQVFDIVQIGDGKFLNNIKNSFNGLRFGFGIPERQIKIAAALHGPANLLNYDDYVWEKYQIGEWLKVTDPVTGKPAAMNLFYNSKIGLKQESSDKKPDDLDSIYQDTSMQALQLRGAKFLSCHTALEEQVRAPHLSQQAVAISGRHREGHACAHRAGSDGRRIHGRRDCHSSGRRPLHVHHSLAKTACVPDGRASPMTH